MTPIHFPQANKILAAPLGRENDISPLPVHSDGKQCLSCWRLTWSERIRALLHGRVWLCTLTGPTQPPVWLDARRTVFPRAQPSLAPGNPIP